MTTPTYNDEGGASEALAVAATAGYQDAGGAADTLAAAIAIPVTLADAAAATDGIAVVSNTSGLPWKITATGAGTTTTLVASSAAVTAAGVVPGQTFQLYSSAGLLVQAQNFTITGVAGGTITFIPPAAAATVSGEQAFESSSGAATLPAASPAFILSRMPRMHAQNILTGQWLHRDVQGITSPMVTWMLNGADTFTAKLSPPRPDMMDATGNPLMQEWQTAVYLEENDEIKFGGILTSSTMQGPDWTITCTGFAGYPNGMPYEGPVYKQVGIDGLDVVRYLWGWLQGQPNGNLGMVLGPDKAGAKLGAFGLTSTFTTLTSQANPGDKRLNVISNVGFSAATALTVDSEIKVVAGGVAVPSTQIPLSAGLLRVHAAGAPVVQRVSTTLTKAATPGQKLITVQSNTGFAAGQSVQVGNETGAIPHGVTVTPVQLPLASGLAQGHPVGTVVSEATPPTPFELDWWNSTDVGQEISSIQQECIFDYREVHTWADPNKQGVRHQLMFGVPRVGRRRTDLRFAETENIVASGQITRDGTKFANNVVGTGAGSGSSLVRATVSALNSQIRRTIVYQDQTVTNEARMQVKAQKVLTASQNIDTPSSITVMSHPNAPFGSFIPGDDILVILASGWRSAAIWCRITQMAQDPTTDLMTITLARSDSYTYMAQSGQAGTI